MKKDEFIEKWCPETPNSRMKDVNYKITYDPEFESDLNALLTETAEKQRVRDLAIHSINRTKPFHEIKEAIHNTPLRLPLLGML